MWRVAVLLVIAVRTVAADQPPRSTCDAAAREKAGDDAWAQGFELRAFDQYEKAVRCEPQERRILKTGYAACAMYQRNRDDLWAKKAKRYYDLLRRDDNKQKLAQACAPRCRLEY